MVTRRVKVPADTYIVVQLTGIFTTKKGKPSYLDPNPSKPLNLIRNLMLYPAELRGHARGK